MARKTSGRQESFPSNTDPPVDRKEAAPGDFMRWIAPFLDPAGLVVVSACLSAQWASQGVVDPLKLGFIYGMSVFSIFAYWRLKK